ncbi:MAG: hypothetical protein ACOZNI_07165 [Myxococcota bacterium]
MLLALTALAHAQDGGNLTDLVADAKKAVAEADFAAAKTRLYEAEGYMPRAAVPLPGELVAQVPFLFGVISWQEGDREVAMGWWRKAVVMAPQMAPERAAFPDMEAQDVFHAIAEEVRSGDEVVLPVPGDAPGSLWIDGVERMDGDSAPLGRHLVQVRCADDRVTGAWHELGAPPADWWSICEGGTYATATKKSKPSKSKPASKPVAEEEEDLDAPDPKAKSTKSSSSGSARKKSGGGAGKDIAGISLIAASAAGGVATWVTYNQASQAYDSWEAKKDAVAENPELKPAEYRTDVLIPRMNLFYATAGGTALLLAGGVTLVLVDEGPSVAPLPGGGAILWNGRF